MQETQALAGLLSLSALPSEQFWQRSAPRGAYCPATHVAHAVAGLESWSALPAAHVTHDEAFAGEYCPVEQLPHTVRLAAE